MAPSMSESTSAEIPDMSGYSEQSKSWLSNYICNRMLRGDYKNERFRQHVFNFLRKAEGAFIEYALAREATVRYLQLSEAKASPYMEAVLHWEHFLAQAWQGYDLLVKGLEHKVFESGSQSQEHRLNVLYNASKHHVGDKKIPIEATIPVWMTPDGLRCSEASLTFIEAGEVLKNLAYWASALQDPLTAMEKLQHR